MHGLLSPHPGMIGAAQSQSNSFPGSLANWQFAKNRYYGSAAIPTSNRNSASWATAKSNLVLPFSAYQPDITPGNGMFSLEQQTNLFAAPTSPATQDITLSATGTYLVIVWGGSGSVTTSAGTATGTGFGTVNAATGGGLQTLTITGAGTIHVAVSGSPTVVNVIQASVQTQPIEDPSAGFTRLADNNTTPLAGTSEFTWRIAWRTAKGLDVNQIVAQHDDGTNNNRLSLYRAATGQLYFFRVVSGSGANILMLASSLANDTDYVVCVRGKSGSYSGSLNGGSEVSVAQTYPTGLTTFRFGHDTVAAFHCNSNIYSAQFWNTYNKDVVALSSLPVTA